MWDNNQKMIQDFVDWAGKQLGVQVLEDWYNIRSEQVRKLGGAYILQKKGGLKGLLSHCYPEKEWELGKFVAFRTPFGQQSEQTPGDVGDKEQ